MYTTAFCEFKVLNLVYYFKIRGLLKLILLSVKIKNDTLKLIKFKSLNESD